MTYLVRGWAGTSLGGLTPAMPGKGKKVKALKDMHWATTDRQTGRSPGASSAASQQDMNEAREWLPFPEASQSDQVRALVASVAERDGIPRGLQ